MQAIRRAEKRDIPRILELLLQVLTIHHKARPDLFKGDCRKYTEEELSSILSDSQRPIFVAVDGEDRVLGYGFCIYQQLPDDNVRTDIRTLYIDDLCVDERCRGQHIGRALYDFVVAHARAEGFYNITLNVWEGNDSAKRFYEKLGLKVQKTGMELIL